MNTLDMNVTASLLKYRDGFIESSLELTVLRNYSINGTIVQCRIEDLDNDTAVVIASTSGVLLCIINFLSIYVALCN